MSQSVEPIALTYGDFTWDYTQGYPTPKVTWTTERQRDTAGHFLSEELSINIQGFVSRSGLDYYSNEQQKKTFDVLMEDAENLRDQIIANDNKYFSFTFQGLLMCSGNATMENLEFSPNQNKWTNTIDYSLTLRVPQIGSGIMPGIGHSTGIYITNCSSDITIEPEGRKFIDRGNTYELYRLSRNVSATAKAYDANRGALTFAKGYVEKIAGDFSNIIKHPDFRLYNRTSTVDLSETDGTYSVQDNYILKSGEPWIHSEQIELSTQRDSDIRSVTLVGEVEGLEYALSAVPVHTGKTHHSGLLDISGVVPQLQYTKGDKYQFIKPEEGEEATQDNYTKYDNAVSGYMLLTDKFFETAMAYNANVKDLNNTITDRPLHGIPVSIEEGYSPQQGRITYSRTYDSRPTGLLKDAIFESLTLSDVRPRSLITPVPVIGRRLGPLYHNPQGYSNVRDAKFASGVGSRTISYEAFFPKYTGLANYKFPQEIINKIDTYLNLYSPKGDYKGFVKDDTQELDLTENRLTMSITWEYIECDP